MIRIAVWAFLAGLVAGALWATRGARDHDVYTEALERWERVSHHAEVAQRVRRDSTAHVATIFRDRWRGFRVDTLTAPGKPDTVTVPVLVLATADSAITADSVALTASDSLAGLLQAHVDSADRLAALYRTKARGPFFRRSAELLFEDGVVWGAAELEAGYRVSAVARLEVDTTARFAVGIRVRF